MNKHKNTHKKHTIQERRNRRPAVAQNTLTWVMVDGKAVLKWAQPIPLGTNRALRRKEASKLCRMRKLLI